MGSAPPPWCVRIFVLPLAIVACKAGNRPGRARRRRPRSARAQRGHLCDVACGPAPRVSLPTAGPRTVPRGHIQPRQRARPRRHARRGRVLRAPRVRSLRASSSRPRSVRGRGRIPQRSLGCGALAAGGARGAPRRTGRRRRGRSLVCARVARGRPHAGRPRRVLVRRDRDPARRGARSPPARRHRLRGCLGRVGEEPGLAGANEASRPQRDGSRIFHSGRERFRHVSQAASFSEEMRQSGRPTRVHIVPPAGKTVLDGHTFCNGSADPPWGPEVLDFLRATMVREKAQ